MATLRWTTPHPPVDDVVVFASRLPVPSWWAFVALTWASLAVRAQLRRSPGLVAFTLVADVRRRTLWTASAWCSADEMGAFVAGEPHRSVMGRHAGQLGAPTFRRWRAPAAAAPRDRAAIAEALTAVAA